MTREDTILDVLACEARERVEADSASVSLLEMRARALDTPIRSGFPFEKALSVPGLSFICEVKKASPSKGLISPDFPYMDIAEDYEAAGAAAISVLTEPKRFLGADAYLEEIVGRVSIPVLRKDFTVSAYQIYQARVLGASAVLLICSIISEEQLSEYLGVAEELGLSALVEAHDRTEVERAVQAGARVIGVNNRNLKDFSVDTSNSTSLRALVPPDRIFVSESGVATPQDAAMVALSGADAVLVGEALMRSADRRGFLRNLRQAATLTPAVKICGISRAEDVPVLNEMLPEYAGFVFHPASRRYVDLDTARHLREMLDEKITTVGVFVDAPIPQIVEAVESGAISMVQLHGSEDPAYIADLRQALPRTPLIKAIAATDTAAIENIAGYESPCDSLNAVDYIMVDAARPGSGESFDWDLLGIFPATIPVFLAGGLTPDTAADAARLGVYAVDVSSGVETGGVKDPQKIRSFIMAVRARRQEGHQ